ncbi:MAG TPA: phospholipase D-like domain-containing protein [Candidatus Paceibacterota bacterium]|jgi:phosphatidylserine/phosphatidylglycerophosphate/cardiolipin synthase-like enzyme|nr:phospholipase D-like domain-containing protein [Candidatus Paceibacterota bacterium]
MGSRKTGVVFGVIALALLFISGAALYGSRSQIGASAMPKIEAAPAFSANSSTSTFALITEPQDGMASVERLIESASSSIDVVMYEFNDTNIEQLLAQRAREGISVRVILDNGYFGAGSSINQEAFDYLQNNGVQVHWSPSYFALTHEKALIIDSSRTLIMTFNFTPHYYKSDRDFGIVDMDQNDAAAIEQAFDSDWNGQNSQAQRGEGLVWSPDSREQILALINGAQSSLEIYNEEMQDAQVISALEAASERGVDVELIMTYSSNWKSAFQELSGAGVHIRTYKASAPLYIHAKVVIADAGEAFIGSENFSSTSLDQNRELGVIVSDPEIVTSLMKTFTDDWSHATPLLVQ